MSIESRCNTLLHSLYIIANVSIIAMEYCIAFALHFKRYNYVLQKCLTRIMWLFEICNPVFQIVAITKKQLSVSGMLSNGSCVALPHRRSSSNCKHLLQPVALAPVQDTRTNERETVNSYFCWQRRIASALKQHFVLHTYFI